MEKSPFPLVPLHWFGFGYTTLVVSGGIVGYVKTGRVPALAAGLLFGSLAGLGSYQMSQDPRNVWLFLAATSVTFVGVLGLRSYYYGKVMPVGLIAGARYFHVTLLYHVEFSLFPRILYAFKTLLVSGYLMLCIS
uniref:Transmembrane protein 14B n=1 Tax=Rhinopithecus roxellana TaxID=61622 RepID=A0A2K6QSM2_RHIRO